MEKKIVAHFIHWWKEYFYSKKSCYNSFETLLKRYGIELECFYDTKNKISNTKDKQMNNKQTLYLKQRIQIFYTTKFFKITRLDILIFSI